MNPLTFVDMELTEGKYRVVLEYIGEGADGDFDESDPDDEPLLRFSCYEKIDGEFESIDDASYCTQLTTDTPRDILDRALKVIMRELKDARDGGSSGKKAMEQMSWLSIRDFQEKVAG